VVGLGASLLLPFFPPAGAIAVAAPVVLAPTERWRASSKTVIAGLAALIIGALAGGFLLIPLGYLWGYLMMASAGPAPG
jgi:hypothetical protein